ncbi:uncharacterized protein LOC103710877 isoform X2 [Phoenix dactylifera]|uniref:Uncharacterized protein LOC103710877 isoform X2 n=1 Tax=Phoenix dactylifera TaxID=42345 RepID=A0A8B7CA66_PHODC|nr:uncharacterized protein LOC103710877 isoform X2 [Phoenix dactylifera]
MDAVELPLPVNVVVSKLLATEGFGRVGEPENRGSDAADAPVFGSHKISGCSPCSSDAEHQHSISECSSVSRHKKIDRELCMNENMPPSSKCEGNGKRHHLGEADMPILSLAKREGRSLNKKSVKKPNTFSCSKRPRIDQPENSVTNSGIDDRNIISRTIGSDSIPCSSADKSRMVKQKRGQDGKRTDKKNFRGCLRSKFDCFTTKAGLTNCDSASGGNNILGIYGLKSDLRDVTKHMDDLSLNELLDGNYKYPNICPEKGKRASTVNENILISVRKACSILPLHGAVDNNGNGKAVINLLNHNCSSLNLSECDNKDKGIEELVSCSKDPCQLNLNDSTLYQPKDILKRLTLPAAQDLNALLLELNMTMVPLRSTVHMTTFCHASLPPFPWSFCHPGACKPSVDVGKLPSTKSTSQGKWVRIGSNSTSLGDDQSCFSEMELKSFNHNEDMVIQHKVNDLLQDVNTLATSVRPLSDGPSSTLCNLSVSPEAHSSDDVDLKKDSGVFGSFISKMLNLTEEHVDTSDCHLEFDHKDSVVLGTSESEIHLRFKGLEPNLVDPSQTTLQFEDSEVTRKAQHTVGRDGYSENCSCYSCKSTFNGCDQNSQYFPTPKISKQGSLRGELHAAEILYAMRHCSNAIKNRSHDSGRIKWPKTSSQKTMKARKSASPMDKTEFSFLAGRHHDPVGSSGPAFVRHKLMSEKKKDFMHMNNTGRGPARWSVPAEGIASPSKLEKDPAISTRPSHSSAIRPPSLMSSPARGEKGCDNQQKLRKATVTSSVTFGGSCIKDWNKGRSKRV